MTFALWPFDTADQFTQDSNNAFPLDYAQNRRLKTLLMPLYYKDKQFVCRNPCTKNVFTTRHVQTTPSGEEGVSALILSFDKTVEVTHSAFSIDPQTFLTRLGGSVSSGRTLLWILVSLLGAAQVMIIWKRNKVVFQVIWKLNKGGLASFSY